MDKTYILAGLGGGVLLIALYLARQASDDSLVGVPKIQTEAQIGAWGDDVEVGVNEKSPLDMTPEIHFYDEGWNCPGQTLRAPRHRYPIVSGGNISAVMHHGMSVMANGSPDNAWRVTPPSEVTL